MKKILKPILICLGVLIVGFIIYKSAIVREVIYLILISFIIAYTLKPLAKKLVEKGLNKRAAAGVIIGGLVIIIVGVFAFLIPSMFKESQNIVGTIEKIQRYFDNFYNNFVPENKNSLLHSFLETGNERANKTIKVMVNKFVEYLLGAGEDMISFAVSPIIVYYFLVDSDIIENKLLMLFPLKYRQMVKNITVDIDKVLGRYIFGQFLLCILIGAMTLVVLLPLGVNFPVTLSMLNGIFNIIPYFGPIFGAVPAIAMAFIESPKVGIITVVWLIVLQQIEGNILAPKITADSVSMHPLVVIMLLVIGGKIGGFLGMVLAVPVGVVIKVIYEDLNYYLF